MIKRNLQQKNTNEFTYRNITATEVAKWECGPVMNNIGL